MNLFRRLFGLSEDDSAHDSEDQISISQSAPDTSKPPEPTIEAPSSPVEKSDNGQPEKGMEEGESEVAGKKKLAPAILAATRQLPPLEPFVAMPGQRVAFGHRSDVGMVRGNNQDSMYSLLASGVSNEDFPDFGLFVVADGMGGHQEGERASAITTRMVTQHVLSDILTPMLNQELDNPDRPGISDVLRTAVEKANDAVAEEVPEGGTTVTCAVIMGDIAHIAHVGDSRAYLITDEGVDQITRDHSLVQRLIELDQLTVEEAAEHPQRNVLYRAIGQTDNLDVDAITRRLGPRARLLLCSDGLWNMVSEDIIRETVLAHSNPQESCNQLVEMANERGGPDNITVIIVQMPG